jgi:hypothetical protein
MGLLQKWGGEVSKTWKKGWHYVNDRWGHAAEWVDRKIPEFKVDIKHDIQVNKDNFNVNMDSEDIAKAGKAIGTGIGKIGTGLQGIANSFESFGQSLSHGLEALGAEIAQSVQNGLDELGNDLVAASTQLTAGVTSHGASIEHAAETLGMSATNVAHIAAGSIRESIAALVSTIDRFDATGGVGRHLMSVISHAQSAGSELLTLDRYFSRVGGEYLNDSYLLKVANSSERPYPGFEFFVDVMVEGLGGQEFQRLIPDLRPTQGHYHLKFLGDETTAIRVDTSPFEVELYLAALPSIGAGKVRCFGTSLNLGVMEIVLDDTLAANDISIDLHDSDGSVAVEREAKNEMRKLTVRVSGDPDQDGLISIGRPKAINLGPVRREFGVPFISSMDFRLIESPQTAQARDLSMIARNKVDDGSGGEIDSDPVIPVDMRRKAANELSQLGPFAIKELQKLKDSAAVTDLDRLTRKILLASATAIESFGLSATSTVFLSGGEKLEPISMLKTAHDSTMLARNHARLARVTQVQLAVEYLALEMSLSNDSRSYQLVTTSAQPFGISLLGDSVSQGGSGGARALTQAFRPTMSLSEAINRTRVLGEDLRRFIPPDIFDNSSRQNSLYDIVREVLNPTIKELHRYQTEFKRLKAEFDASFGGYWSTGLHDPVLTHLIGVEVLEYINEGFEAEVTIMIEGRRSGTVVKELFTLKLSRLNGESLFSVPLRSCGIEPYKVTVSVIPNVAAGVNIPIVLSHFAGIGDSFTLYDQVKAEELVFDVKRLVVIE